MTMSYIDDVQFPTRKKAQDVKRQTKFSTRQKSADTDNFFSKEDWNCIIFLKKFQAFQMTMR